MRVVRDICPSCEDRRWEGKITRAWLMRLTACADLLRPKVRLVADRRRTAYPLKLPRRHQSPLSPSNNNGGDQGELCHTHAHVHVHPSRPF